MFGFIYMGIFLEWSEGEGDDSRQSLTIGTKHWEQNSELVSSLVVRPDNLHCDQQYVRIKISC